MKTSRVFPNKLTLRPPGFLLRSLAGDGGLLFMLVRCLDVGMGAT